MFLFLTFLPYLPSVYFISRLSLLYPATAVDKVVNVQWAWAISKNNGWRLTIVVGLLPLIFAFFNFLLLRENATWVEEIISQVLSFILLAVEIVALSLSYKHLTENQIVDAESH